MWFNRDWSYVIHGALLLSLAYYVYFVLSGASVKEGLENAPSASAPTPAKEPAKAETATATAPAKAEAPKAQAKPATDSAAPLSTSVKEVPKAAAAAATVGALSVEEPLSKEDYTIYRRIIDAFNQALDRYPNPNELFFHFRKVKDGELKVENVKNILLTSDEYKRAAASQTNMINASLAHTINDEQLTQTAISAYQQVMFANPSQTTVMFLKEQLRDKFQMDEKKLVRFIEKMYKTDAKAAPTATATTTAKATEAKKPAAASEPNKPAMEGKIDAGSGDISKAAADLLKKTTGQSATVIFSQPTINVYGSYPSGSSFDTIASDKLAAKPKKETTPALSADTTYTCPRTAEEWDLAKLQNQRNMDQLQYGCDTTKKYINADDNMKLFPEYEWSVPMKRPPVCLAPKGAADRVSPLREQTALIGTLLEDATNTSVGSILPKFEFREIRNS